MVTAHEFIEKHLGTIDGWLHAHAVYVTELLFHAQNDLVIDGINLEIGVWKGKYLSALAALAPNREAYGLDVFLHNQENAVASTIAQIAPEAAVSLVRCNTANLTSEAFAALLGNKNIAFASIDGSHQAGPVKNDLENVSSSLTPGGIMAIDDFINPLTLGVVEGATNFLRENPSFEPICYCANKLFVTTAGWGELYQIRLRMWLEDGASQILLGTKSVNWGQNTTLLYGKLVLAI